MPRSASRAKHNCSRARQQPAAIPADPFEVLGALTDGATTAGDQEGPQEPDEDEEGPQEPDEN